MADIQDPLKSLQYSGGAIYNKPAGERTEKPILNVPGLKDLNQVTPDQAELYLSADREDFAKVAKDLNDKLGQQLEPVDAVQILLQRMQDLTAAAMKAARSDDKLHQEQGRQLATLCGGVPCDRNSLNMRIGAFFSWLLSESTDSFKANEEQRFQVVGGITYDTSRRFSSPSAEVRQMQEQAERVLRTWDRVTINPHIPLDKIVPSAELKEMNEFFAQHGIKPISDRHQMEPGYRIDPVLGRGPVRMRGDVIIYAAMNEKETMLRLNPIVIKLAARGVYQKGVSEDLQQLAYPSSPLTFYTDHISRLPDERLKDLVGRALEKKSTGMLRTDGTIWTDPQNVERTGFGGRGVAEDKK